MNWISFISGFLIGAAATFIVLLVLSLCASAKQADMHFEKIKDEEKP